MYMIRRTDYEKKLALLLALIMCVSLCACGQEQTNTNAPESGSQGAVIPKGNTPNPTEAPTEAPASQPEASPEPTPEPTEAPKTSAIVVEDLARKSRRE